MLVKVNVHYLFSDLRTILNYNYVATKYNCCQREVTLLSWNFHFSLQREGLVFGFKLVFNFSLSDCKTYFEISVCHIVHDIWTYGNVEYIFLDFSNCCLVFQALSSTCLFLVTVIVIRLCRPLSSSCKLQIKNHGKIQVNILHICIHFFVLLILTFP